MHHSIAFLEERECVEKQCRAMPPQFSHHNKGFINYVFCRNWAVRNPAGTRLDSSLVKKQVDPPLLHSVVH